MRSGCGEGGIGVFVKGRCALRNGLIELRGRCDCSVIDQCLFDHLSDCCFSLQVDVHDVMPPITLNALMPLGSIGCTLVKP